MKNKFTLSAVLLFVSLCGNLKAGVPDGSLLQADGSVFLIRDGKRCAIPTYEILEANGLAGKKVKKVSTNEINSIPEGKALTMRDSPQVQLKEADLMQGTGSVYVFENGERRKVETLVTFNKSGFKTSEINHISDEQIEAIPEGPRWLAPYKQAEDNDLVQAEGAVFLIKDGKRCTILNEKAFEDHGFNASDIVQVSDEDLAEIPLGDPLETK